MMTDIRPLLHRLRSARQAAGLTRQQIGGLSWRSLQNWETGQTIPSLANAARWAASLGYRLLLQPSACTRDATADRIALLEDALGTHDAEFFPLPMRPQARIIFGVLLKRDGASADMLATALYSGRADCDWPADPRNVVAVYICELRRLLAEYGQTIKTQRGALGEATRFRLPPATKAWARTLLAQQRNAGTAPPLSPE